MIMALDKQTGKKLWQFSVGSPVGVESPSAGNALMADNTVFAAIT
jgi:outer membrane protein assembly factor BamB